MDNKLTLIVITATLLLLSISIPTRGEVEADNITYIPAEGQEIEFDVGNETAFPHRVLATFMTCAQCKCCPGPGATNCSVKQCCHKIVCDPDTFKCSLKPFKCNCDSCS